MIDTSHLPKVGSRVRAQRLAVSPGSKSDDNRLVPPGTQGTVERIHDAGPLYGFQILVKWDNGRHLFLLEREDQWEDIKPEDPDGDRGSG